jgi:hypothetical protein
MDCEMQQLVDLWPIVSGVVVVAAVAVAFRAEILVRVKNLEDKVKTLFELFNSKSR